jgi:hypothetical protein
LTPLSRDQVPLKTASTIATFATHGAIHDLVVLLQSLEIHHAGATVHLLCDSAVQHDLQERDWALDLYFHNKLDEYTGETRSTMTQKGVWGRFMLCKADIMDTALESAPDVLFLDCDILCTHPIRVPAVDEPTVGLSPGYIPMETGVKVGQFNAGFMWLNKQAQHFLVSWRHQTHLLGLHSCADQLSLGAALKHVGGIKQVYLFGPEHNFQSWRYVLDKDSSCKHVAITGNSITVNNQPLTTIHTHFYESQYAEANGYFKYILARSHKYRELLIIDPVSYTSNPSHRMKLSDWVLFLRRGGFNCAANLIRNASTTNAQDGFTPFTIGVQYQHTPTIITQHQSESMDPTSRPHLVFMGITESNDVRRRGPVHRQIVQTLQEKGIKNTLLPQAGYLNMLASVKFVISPEGNGVDCHRHYESLVMGAVPIVEDSELARRKYCGCPVLFTSKLYTEITPEYLEREYERMLEEEYDFSTLFLTNYPEAARGRILSNSRHWLRKFNVV